MKSIKEICNIDYLFDIIRNEGFQIKNLKEHTITMDRNKIRFKKNYTFLIDPWFHIISYGVIALLFALLPMMFLRMAPTLCTLILTLVCYCGIGYVLAVEGLGTPKFISFFFLTIGVLLILWVFVPFIGYEMEYKYSTFHDNKIIKYLYENVPKWVYSFKY